MANFNGRFAKRPIDAEFCQLPSDTPQNDRKTARDKTRKRSKLEQEDLSPAKGVAVAAGLGGLTWLVLGWLIFG